METQRTPPAPGSQVSPTIREEMGWYEFLKPMASEHHKFTVHTTISWMSVVRNVFRKVQTQAKLYQVKPILFCAVGVIVWKPTWGYSDPLKVRIKNFFQKSPVNS